MTHVKEDVRMLGWRIGEAIQCNSPGRRHFHSDVIALQLDAIVADAGLLLIAHGTVVIARWISHGWLYEDIAVFGASASAADMGLAKAEDVSIGRPASVPIVVCLHVWTGFDHAEWQRWTGKSISTAVRSKKWIHVLR